MDADDETMRTFAGVGIAERLLPGLHVQRTYEWRNGAGELLLEHDFAERGRSGWAEWYMMYQPDLEDALHAVCQGFPRVQVSHRAEVTGLEQDAAGVTLAVAGGVGSAVTTAFKLDLVLRGRADPDLLGSYQTEREPHVRAVTEQGIELGRLQTLRDPEAAAHRDRRLLAERAARRAPEKISFPGLGAGFLASASAGGRGELSVQGVVDDGTRRGLLDAVVGVGFLLLAEVGVVDELERTGSAAALRAAGVGVHALSPVATPGALHDVDGTYRRWLAGHGAAAVVVRPDFYVYGTARDAAGAGALAAELTGALDPVPAPL